MNKTDKYTWEQTLRDVTMYIPVTGANKRNVDVKFSNVCIVTVYCDVQTKIHAGIKGQAPVVTVSSNINIDYIRVIYTSLLIMIHASGSWVRSQ